MSYVTPCTVLACGQAIHARSLCNEQYELQRAGRPLASSSRRKPTLMSDEETHTLFPDRAQRHYPEPPDTPGYTKARRAQRRPPCSQEARLHDHQPLPPKTSLEGLPDPRAVLTNRQLLVFALTAAGFSAEEIAQKLCCSRRTVETHRDHIGKRLQIHSKLDLWRLALRHQLVTLDVPLVSENPR